MTEASRVQKLLNEQNAEIDRLKNRIEKLEAGNLKAALIKVDDMARIEKLEAVTKDDARWLSAYYKWCEMNGCAPSSSDLISARKALEGKDD